MNIEDRINKIKFLKFDYACDINRESMLLKEDFERYIADETINFKDRWNTFIRAPQELSQHMEDLGYFEFPDLPEEHACIMHEIESQIFQSHIFPNTDVNLKSIYVEYFDEKGKIDLDNVRWDIKYGEFSDDDLTYFVMKTAQDLMKANVKSFNHGLDKPWNQRKKSQPFISATNKIPKLIINMV